MEFLHRVKKRLTWFFGGGAVLIAVLQLTNPALTNPPVIPGHNLMATNAPPPQIAKMLQGACYDCHSNKTKWPWYSHVAPVSWWVTGHVHDARRKLNFSDWPHGDALREVQRWRHVRGQIKSGDMPLWSYTLMHPAARLTTKQRQQLVDWIGQEIKHLQS